jgi:nicotinate-nucleotide pyrophosphorylase (carboxylating)
VQLAILEDLNRLHDWTTAALVPVGREGSAAVVARQPGVVAGLPAAAVALDEMGAALQWDPLCQDGQSIETGTTVARMSGPVRHLLTGERLVLNLLSRLSGIATLTRRYVDAVADHRARIYDTRKTTPGWRRLEKYAVRCGGGCNHRTGLFDAALIKDNHLAVGAMADHGAGFSPAAAVTRVRQFVADAQAHAPQAEMIVEIEVDTLDQLKDALTASPDIVLLDNMSLQMLRRAVILRDELAPQVELEASGNMRLDRVARVAGTGVTRISVGALTHSAIGLDFGLDVDWRTT